MPSPVGHALGGALFGGLVAAGPRAPITAGKSAADRAALGAWIGPEARVWRQVAVLGLVGMLPDLDLLFSLHGQYTHSAGAALLVGVLGWLVSGRDTRWGLAVVTAYASHVLFDWLGQDTTPPIGIMALWPFSGEFYQSGHPVFMAISRRYWLPGFVAHNLRAITWEVALLGPATWLVWAGRGKTTERGTDRATDRGTERGTERGTQRITERGTDRRTDRGTERITEGRSRN